MLAELDHLRPDDLLWRPGFDAWKPAGSIPGLLTPPPLPKGSPAIEVKAKRAPETVTNIPPPIDQKPPTLDRNTGAPQTRSDDVPQFLVGLVANPSPRPNWVVIAKDRLRTSRLGPKVSSLGWSVTSLGSHQIVHRMKRPRVVMAVVGGVILIGALNVILAKAFSGDEKFALRSSALPEASDLAEKTDAPAANRKSKIQNRFSDLETTEGSSSKPAHRSTARDEIPSKLPSAIEMDPEFLRPKTIPRPVPVESATATGALKPPSAPPSIKSDSAMTASTSKTVINVNTPKGTKLVQMRLNELGYLSTPPNGLWGQATTKALEAFVANARITNYQGWSSTVERALFATEAPRSSDLAEPKP